MALYGEVKIAFNDDGSVSLDASHCTADGGSSEIQGELLKLARELGGTWKQEKHLLRDQHHTHNGHDHHIHH